MRSSIFEIENRLDINKEYKRMRDALFKDYAIHYDYRDFSLYGFLDKYVFNLWNYRDTFTDIDEYLMHIGVDIYSDEIDENSFLNLCEFLLNIMKVANEHYNFNNIAFKSLAVKNIIGHNIPIILERMNYEYIEKGNILYIRKRDADIDSIIETVPENIAELLLEYNDIRNNNLESKKTILKKIDLYIDKNKGKYKSIGKDLLDSIETIVNKMGINHEVNENPYNQFNDSELCIWYDKCFKMMIHLIRIEEIIEIKKERNKLIKKSLGDVKDD